MNEMPDRQGHEKAARALQLFEQGLSRAAIAERLGVVPKNVPGMLQRAKQRRDKAGEVRA